MKKLLFYSLCVMQAVSVLGCYLMLRFTQQMLRESAGGQSLLAPSFAILLTAIYFATQAALSLVAWRQFKRGEDNAAIAVGAMPILMALPPIALAFVRFFSLR